MISEKQIYLNHQSYSYKNVYGSNIDSPHYLKPINTKQPFNRKRIIQKQIIRSRGNMNEDIINKGRQQIGRQSYNHIQNPETFDIKKRYYKTPAQHLHIRAASPRQLKFCKSIDDFSQNNTVDRKYNQQWQTNDVDTRRSHKNTWNIMENNFKQSQFIRSNQKKSNQDILKRIKQCLSPQHSYSSVLVKSRDQTISCLSSYEQISTKSSANIKQKNQQFEQERWRSNTNFLGCMKFMKNKIDVSPSQQLKMRKRSIQIQRTIEQKTLSKFLSQSNLIPATRNEIHMKKPKPINIKDFMIGKILGEGRYGTIFEAIHKQLGCIFALKRIKKSKIKQYKIQKQLASEIKHQMTLNHPNIVKMYGYFSDSEYVYMILEYMEEGSLFDAMQKQNKILQQTKVSKIIKQIGDSIEHLQSMDLAHRDIKPQNILKSFGTHKLCDLGWIVSCSIRRKTFCGTLGYVAPQVLEGKQYDKSVDLWSLGILTYQLLTGKILFKQHQKDKQIKINYEQIKLSSSLSRQSKSFIQSLIKKDPYQRINISKLLRHSFLINV